MATEAPPAPGSEEERHLRSVSDMAANGETGEAEAEAEDDGTQQLVIPGTSRKLSGTIGGARPTESYFKMSSVALAVAGDLELPKDTELWIAVPVAIDEVTVRNRRKDGAIVSVARVHHAKAIGQPVVLDNSPVASDAS